MFDNSPYFNRMNSSVVDSIADKVIYNAKLSRDSVVDDFKRLYKIKPINKSIDYIVNSVKEANDSTRSVIVGNVGSAVINGFIVFYYFTFKLQY